MLTCRALELAVDGRALCSGVDLDVEPGDLWGGAGPERQRQDDA